MPQPKIERLRKRMGDTVVRTHEFKINGYSLVKGMGVGKFVASDTIAVGGYA